MEEIAHHGQSTIFSKNVYHLGGEEGLSVQSPSGLYQFNGSRFASLELRFVGLTLRLINGPVVHFFIKLFNYIAYDNIVIILTKETA